MAPAVLRIGSHGLWSIPSCVDLHPDLLESTSVVGMASISRSTQMFSSWHRTGSTFKVRCDHHHNGWLIWHRSKALVAIAMQHQPSSAIIADALELPHPDSTFDFAISIAVLHHLSTPARRIQGIETILRTLRHAKMNQPGGRLLVVVWALEQKTSRRGWDIGHTQDVLVTWISRESQSNVATASTGADKIFHRYYHLYQSGELESNIAEAGGVVLKSGYERDNWWAVAERKESK